MHRLSVVVGGKKRTRLLFWPTVLTLVLPKLPRVFVPSMWAVFEKAGSSVKPERLCPLMSHGFFSSLHAAIMAGQGVKGATVAKHAGIHRLWVTLPPALAALWRRVVARVRWQLLQRRTETNRWGISSGQILAGCFSAPAFGFFICIQTKGCCRRECFVLFIFEALNWN